MAKQFPEISTELSDFIAKQKLFFVATADQDSRINLSPKGIDSFRVMDKNRVIWLNFTGSGNETAAHLLAQNRMTIMFCSFDEKPTILRLYGKAKTIHERDSEWNELIKHFPNSKGARQVFDVEIELVQTSCGYAVPMFDYVGERGTLERWAEKKGEDGVREYWQSNNTTSIDGKPTGI